MLCILFTPNDALDDGCSRMSGTPLWSLSAIIDCIACSYCLRTSGGISSTFAYFFPLIVICDPTVVRKIFTISASLRRLSTHQKYHWNKRCHQLGLRQDFNRAGHAVAAHVGLNCDLRLHGAGRVGAGNVLIGKEQGEQLGVMSRDRAIDENVPCDAGRRAVVGGYVRRGGEVCRDLRIAVRLN